MTVLATQPVEETFEQRIERLKPQETFTERVGRIGAETNRFEEQMLYPQSPEAFHGPLAEDFKKYLPPDLVSQVGQFPGGMRGAFYKVAKAIAFAPEGESDRITSEGIRPYPYQHSVPLRSSTIPTEKQLRLEAEGGFHALADEYAHLEGLGPYEETLRPYLRAFANYVRRVNQAKADAERETRAMKGRIARRVMRNRREQRDIKLAAAAWREEYRPLLKPMAAAGGFVDVLRAGLVGLGAERLRDTGPRDEKEAVMRAGLEPEVAARTVGGLAGIAATLKVAPAVAAKVGAPGALGRAAAWMALTGGEAVEAGEDRLVGMARGAALFGAFEIAGRAIAQFRNVRAMGKGFKIPHADAKKVYAAAKTGNASGAGQALHDAYMKQMVPRVDQKAARAIDKLLKEGDRIARLGAKRGVRELGKEARLDKQAARIYQGIRARAETKGLYAQLGIRADASPEQIDLAFQQIAKISGVKGEPASAAEMAKYQAEAQILKTGTPAEKTAIRELQAARRAVPKLTLSEAMKARSAYEVLRNPDLRAKYDAGTLTPADWRLRVEVPTAAHAAVLPRPQLPVARRALPAKVAAPEEAVAVRPAKPKPKAPLAPAARAEVQRRGREFQQLERELVTYYEELAGEGIEAPRERVEAGVEDAEQYGFDHFIRAFAKTVPTELAEALKGRPRLRMMVKGDVPGATGEAFLKTIGTDRYVEGLEQITAGRKGDVSRAIDWLEESFKGKVPDADMALKLRRYRALERPKAGGPEAVEVVTAESLRAGDAFTIEGDRYEVTRKADGGITIQNDVKGEIAAEATIPIDKGSLTRAAVPARAAPERKPAPRPITEAAVEYTYEGLARPVQSWTLPSDYADKLLRLEAGGQFGRAVYSEPLPEDVVRHLSLRLISKPTPEPKALKAKIEAIVTPPPKAAPAAIPALDIKRAGTLRRMADQLQKHIDDKRRPMTQNPTPKRMAQYRGRLHDADNLERTQQAMRALADAREAGTLPGTLADLRTRSAIEPLVRKGLEPGGYYDVIPSRDYSDKSAKAVALQQLTEGAETPEVQAVTAAREAADRISRLEEEVRFAKIPGFFPTPSAVIDKMLGRAGIEAGMRVLEPSAGKGDIADAIQKAVPGSQVQVGEISSTLREILKRKGHDLVASNFLELEVAGMEPAERPQRIVMNPPFEKGEDIDHVRHAYELLRPGGRVVSIMSEGSFFRSDKKATAFREWLAEVGGETEKLDPGAFKGIEAFRQTGAAARMVVIDKPAGVVAAAEPARVKFMLTQADRKALKLMGYTERQVHSFKPAEVEKILRPKPAPEPASPTAWPAKTDLLGQTYVSPLEGKQRELVVPSEHGPERILGPAHEPRVDVGPLTDDLGKRLKATDEGISPTFFAGVPIEPLIAPLAVASKALGRAWRASLWFIPKWLGKIPEENPIGRLRDWIGHGLSPAYGRPKTWVRKVQRVRGEGRDVRLVADKLGHDFTATLKKASLDPQRETLHKLVERGLRGQLSTERMAKLPPVVQTWIATARAALDAESLAAAKVFDGVGLEGKAEIYRQNVGEYLKNIPLARVSPTARFGAFVKRLLGPRLSPSWGKYKRDKWIVKHRGRITKYETQQEAERAYVDLVNSRKMGLVTKRGQAKEWTLRREGFVPRKVKGQPKWVMVPWEKTEAGVGVEPSDLYRRAASRVELIPPIPESWRRQYEIHDPRYLIARSIIETRHDAESVRLFDYAAKKWGQTAPKGTQAEIDAWAAENGLAPLPETGRLHNLSGMYVPKAIAQDLTDFSRLTGTVEKVLRAYMSAWKSSKTLYNPATHARNVMGNFMFSYLGGVSPLNPANAQHYLKAAFVDLLHKSENFHYLVKQGVLGAEFFGAELRRVETLVIGKEGSPDRIVMMLRRIHNTVGRAYALEDQVFKMAAFNKYVADGMTRSRAAAEVDKWFPNYDRIGKLTRILRQSPVGMPFASFVDQSLRIAGRAAVEHPIRLAALIALPGIASYLGALATGMSPDEKRLVDEDRGYWEPIMPWRDDWGRAVTLDLRYIMPLANDIVPEMRRDTFLPPWFLGGPVLRTPLEIMINKNLFLGRPITWEDMTAGQKLKAQAWHAFKGITPYPSGLMFGPGRVARAWKGERRETLAMALLGASIGINLRAPYVAERTAKQMIGQAILEGERGTAEAMLEIWNTRYRDRHQKELALADIMQGIRVGWGGKQARARWRVARFLARDRSSEAIKAFEEYNAKRGKGPELTWGEVGRTIEALGEKEQKTPEQVQSLMVHGLTDAKVTKDQAADLVTGLRAFGVETLEHGERLLDLYYADRPLKKPTTRANQLKRYRTRQIRKQRLKKRLAGELGPVEIRPRRKRRIY